MRIAYALLFVVTALLLCGYALVFAQERIIFSDTSGYLVDMINSGSFVVPTNRFVGILAQLLPLAGLGIGFPLPVLVCLYSFNFILLPIVCSVLCWVWLKQFRVALAILLLYVVMSIKLFYYPVSEFRMGLCLLLFYHAFFIYSIKAEYPKKILFRLIGTLLVVTIIFSHPLSIVAFLVWAGWLLVTARISKRALIFPAIAGISALLLKELFFKATLNGQAFDAQRAEGIKNFALLFPHYFEGHLFRSFMQVLTADYFMLLLLLAACLFVLLKRRKVIQALFLAGMSFGLVLLVCVSFYTHTYDYYYEHLLQLLPFLIVLAFCSIDFQLYQRWLAEFSLITSVFALSLVKVYNGHEIRERRFAWYRHYLSLMADLGVQKASLSRDYISIDERGSYWSATSESLLLSSLAGADSSRTLLPVWNYNELNENIKDPGIVAYDGTVVPIRHFNSRYFRLNELHPYVILDSVVSAEILLKRSIVE